MHTLIELYSQYNDLALLVPVFRQISRNMKRKGKAK